MKKWIKFFDWLTTLGIVFGILGFLLAELSVSFGIIPYAAISVVVAILSALIRQILKRDPLIDFDKEKRGFEKYIKEHR